MASVIDVIMRLTDQVTGPLRHIRSEMEENANATRRLGSHIQNAGRGLTNIGQSMLPVATAITAAGAASAKTFMDFDATITAAGVKAGATAAEMEQMRQVAERLGADFPISAEQAAEGMDRLAAGGFNAEQTMDAMPGIIQAAVASGEDLATTSDVVTSALSIWNLKEGDVAANTEHVADVVQMAANVSKLGMQDFGLAMQYAGAPAAALGVNIEELGAAMAIMSNNGIEASTIGTSLRSVMSRLASPPKAAADAIERLGLKTTDAAGHFVGLENVVNQMRTAMAGMSDTEQVAMTKALAGEEAYSGLLALIKTSPEAYAEVADAINNSAGSSQAAYNTMQDTMKGSIDSMKGSVEAFAISLGTVMAPYIRSAAGAIKSLADTLSGLSPASQQLIAGIGLTIIGFTAFVLAAGRAVSMAGAMITVYGQVGQVLAGNHIKNKLLEYSVRGLSTAYTGLSTAATAATSRLASLRAATSAAGGGNILAGAMTTVRARVSAIVATIQAGAAQARAVTWTPVAARMNSAMSAAATAATSAMTSIRARIVGTYNAARGLTWAQVGNAIRSAFESAVTAVRTSMTQLRLAVVNGMNAARTNAIAAANAIRAGIISAFNAARAGAVQTAAVMRTQTVAAFRAVQRNALLAAASVRNFFAGLSLQAAISTVVSGLSSLARGFLAVSRAALAFALSPLGVALMAIGLAAYYILKLRR